MTRSRFRVGLCVPLAAAAATLLAGCGSTVQTTTDTAFGGAAGPAGADGLGTDVPGAVGPDRSGAQGTDRSSTGGMSSGPGGSSEAPGSSGPSGPDGATTGTGTTSGGAAGGSQPPAPGETGPGVTATEIKVGFLIEPGASTIGESLGAASLVGGDHKAEVNAVVADINKRGGILGRKVVPEFVDVDAAQEQSNPAAAAQAACTGLTDDRKVFAAISYIANVNNETMFECMKQKRTPFFGTDLAAHTAASYERRAPYVFAPHTLTVDRLAPVLVKRLKAQAYFTGWDNANGAPGPAPVKVGVIHTEGSTTYREGTLKALAAIGIRDVEVFQHGPTNQETSAGMSSAVLRFRSAGVTHVLMETAGPVLFFLPTAENQGYRPRYGFTSLNGPAALQETGALPPRQFVGSMGTGFAPLTDVGNETGDLSPAQTACRKIMKDAGQDMSSATAFLYMVIACDGFNLIKRALEHAGVANAAGLRAGIDALGTGFVSAAIPAMGWARGRYDAVAAVRDFSYRDERFVYAGPLHAV